MSKTLMLAKTFNKKAIKDGLYYVSEKLDGMPVMILGDGHGDKSWTAWTRQGKEVTSIPHILKALRGRDFLTRHFLSQGTPDFICGELYIPDTPQKDIRGLAVRKEPCEDLELHIFPPFLVSQPLPSCVKNIPAMVITSGLLKKFNPFKDFAHDTIGSPLEGFIAYKLDEPWVAGKRSAQYMKILNQHTLDLKVCGLLEAVSKEGEPLGRVGAFMCLWNDGTTKVGAGKLTHKEAERMWAQFKNTDVLPDIIEVKYKVDPSYDKPREPTFQSVRDDKDEYDISYDKTAKL